MHNKVIFNKIINVSCSFKEIEEFNKDIDKKEFDVDDAFNKYYDVERILYAIRLYENKKINDRYLAYWMTAYNWIISAGFKTEPDIEEITFQQLIRWEISDWLDSLSFFDDSSDWYNLDEYKNAFILVDGIYKNITDWKCVLAHSDEWDENEEDIVLLVINDKTKEFVQIFGDFYCPHKEIQIDKIELDEMKKEIVKLKEKGFKELKYSLTYETEE